MPWPPVEQIATETENIKKHLGANFEGALEVKSWLRLADQGEAYSDQLIPGYSQTQSFLNSIPFEHQRSRPCFTEYFISPFMAVFMICDDKSILLMVSTHPKTTGDLRPNIPGNGEKTINV